MREVNKVYNSHPLPWHRRSLEYLRKKLSNVKSLAMKAEFELIRVRNQGDHLALWSIMFSLPATNSEVGPKVDFSIAADA